ncbi:MAG: oxidoreductase domain protein [Verrucomicrobiales bacterium]|nr:oxidoreductase domain protein [Verrucomicrobiales bacterium]
MPDKVRWGILGTGNIARKFADDLRTLPDARIVAVGSRSKSKAETFGAAFDIPHCHGTPEALATDPEVDCVYVATPHPFHHGNALLCLNAGKAVLCEKPFTINAQQAAEVIQTAQRKKVLLMEAMWTRCFPLMIKFRELLAKKVIGDLQLLTADFGFRAEFDPKSRLFDPHLGGGALLDIGVYQVSLDSMVFGEPTGISGTAVLGETTVDEQASITLKFEAGQLAVLHTTIRANTFCEARLVGTLGRIAIHSPFWKPSKMTISIEGQKDELIEMSYAGHGYHFEASEFMNCFRQGKLESALMPHHETLSIMRTLDTLRGKFGVRYPME